VAHGASLKYPVLRARLRRGSYAEVIKGPARRLRIATSLAECHLSRDEWTKARAVLAPVYETFKQGFNSKGLRIVAQNLSSL
jgi:hypothetical protein